jgi:preprotein translocase subunit SecB
MAETNAAPQADAPANPVFNLEKVYVKDMSIEIPNAPGIFAEQEVPALETTLNINADQFQEGYVEVVVTATATTKLKDKVVFLVEVAQAGIFEMRNIPPEQVDPIVGIHCASIVFPYLRANVADMVTRAGFPALHLPNINFEAFYAQRLEQLRENEANGQAAPTTPAPTKLQ